ncbi:MAG: tetratricopeptide repeat protein, partial [Gallionella sp.]
LFASHPPSDQRVADNQVTLKELGEGGEWGREVYAQKVGHLKATKAAYANYDQGVHTLPNDPKKAAQLANLAIAIEPREARFQELLGDVSLAQKNNQAALGYYDKAIKMQPDYFRPHVQSGIALNNLGRKNEAEQALVKSNALLPTATSHYLLGQLAEGRGDVAAAMQNYQVAASSDSGVGQSSSARLLQLDLARNPAKYLPVEIQMDGKGNLYALVQNPTASNLVKVQLRVVRLNGNTGQAAAQTAPLFINKLASQQQAQIAAGVRIANASEAALYRVQIERVELAK